MEVGRKSKRAVLRTLCEFLPRFSFSSFLSTILAKKSGAVVKPLILGQIYVKKNEK